MTLVIDVEAFDYAVSSTGSEGLILSILHQLDIPIMKNIGINVQPGQDIQIAVTPTLISTNKEAKRRFEPVRRQCYFEDEITLFHFPVEDGYRFIKFFEVSFLSNRSNNFFQTSGDLLDLKQILFTWKFYQAIISWGTVVISNK